MAFSVWVGMTSAWMSSSEARWKRFMAARTMEA